MTEKEFEFDVAFSFHSKDEPLAQQLSDRLSDRMKVFIYSEQQKMLAGRDGEQIFNAVYGGKARVVVVLYRKEWGETPFTRIEQTAIRNRAFNEGFDFTVFIPTDGGGAPPWLPKTRLYVGLDRWGVDGAAAVIEAKVQEAGGQALAESPSDRAARLKRARDFEKAQQDFRSSEKGVAAAKLAYEALKTSLTGAISEIATSSLPSLKATVHGEFLLVSGLGPWMTIVWFCTYSNTLSDSSLRVELLTGPPRLPGLMVWSDPRRLKSVELDYVLLASGESGYKERTNAKREFSPVALAEYLLNFYMERADKFKPDR